jgi:hypothetical protein
MTGRVWTVRLRFPPDRLISVQILSISRGLGNVSVSWANRHKPHHARTASLTGKDGRSSSRDTLAELSIRAQYRTCLRLNIIVLSFQTPPLGHSVANFASPGRGLAFNRARIRSESAVPSAAQPDRACMGVSTRTSGKPAHVASQQAILGDDQVRAACLCLNMASAAWGCWFGRPSHRFGQQDASRQGHCGVASNNTASATSQGNGRVRHTGQATGDEEQGLQPAILICWRRWQGQSGQHQYCGQPQRQ